MDAPTNTTKTVKSTDSLSPEYQCNAQQDWLLSRVLLAKSQDFDWKAKQKLAAKEHDLMQTMQQGSRPLSTDVLANKRQALAGNKDLMEILNTFWLCLRKYCSDPEQKVRSDSFVAENIDDTSSTDSLDPQSDNSLKSKKRLLSKEGYMKFHRMLDIALLGKQSEEIYFFSGQSSWDRCVECFGGEEYLAHDGYISQQNFFDILFETIEVWGAVVDPSYCAALGWALLDTIVDTHQTPMQFRLLRDIKAITTGMDNELPEILTDFINSKQHRGNLKIGHEFMERVSDVKYEVGNRRRAVMLNQDNIDDVVLSMNILHLAPLNIAPPPRHERIPSRNSSRTDYSYGSRGSTPDDTNLLGSRNNSWGSGSRGGMRSSQDLSIDRRKSVMMTIDAPPPAKSSSSIQGPGIASRLTRRQTSPPKVPNASTATQVQQRQGMDTQQRNKRNSDAGKGVQNDGHNVSRLSGVGRSTFGKASRNSTFTKGENTNGSQDPYNDNNPHKKKSFSVGIGTSPLKSIPNDSDPWDHEPKETIALNLNSPMGLASPPPASAPNDDLGFSPVKKQSNLMVEKRRLKMTDDVDENNWEIVGYNRASMAKRETMKQIKEQEKLDATDLNKSSLHDGIEKFCSVSSPTPAPEISSSMMNLMRKQKIDVFVAHSNPVSSTAPSASNYSHSSRKVVANSSHHPFSALQQYGKVVGGDVSFTQSANSNHNLNGDKGSSGDRQGSNPPDDGSSGHGQQISVSGAGSGFPQQHYGQENRHYHNTDPNIHASGHYDHGGQHNTMDGNQHKHTDHTGHRHHHNHHQHRDSSCGGHDLTTGDQIQHTDPNALDVPFRHVHFPSGHAKFDYIGDPYDRMPFKVRSGPSFKSNRTELERQMQHLVPHLDQNGNGPSVAYQELELELAEPDPDGLPQANVSLADKVALYPDFLKNSSPKARIRRKAEYEDYLKWVKEEEAYEQFLYNGVVLPPEPESVHHLTVQMLPLKAPDEIHPPHPLRPKVVGVQCGAADLAVHLGMSTTQPQAKILPPRLRTQIPTLNAISDDLDELESISVPLVRSPPPDIIQQVGELNDGQSNEKSNHHSTGEISAPVVRYVFQGPCVSSNSSLSAVSSNMEEQLSALTVSKSAVSETNSGLMLSDSASAGGHLSVGSLAPLPPRSMSPVNIAMNRKSDSWSHPEAVDGLYNSNVNNASLAATSVSAKTATAALTTLNETVDLTNGTVTAEGDASFQNKQLSGVTKSLSAIVSAPTVEVPAVPMPIVLTDEDHGQETNESKDTWVNNPPAEMKINLTNYVESTIPAEVLEGVGCAPGTSYRGTSADVVGSEADHYLNDTYIPPCGYVTVTDRNSQAYAAASAPKYISDPMQSSNYFDFLNVKHLQDAKCLRRNMAPGDELGLAAEPESSKTHPRPSSRSILLCSVAAEEAAKFSQQKLKPMFPRESVKAMDSSAIMSDVVNDDDVSLVSSLGMGSAEDSGVLGGSQQRTKQKSTNRHKIGAYCPPTTGESIKPLPRPDHSNIIPLHPTSTTPSLVIASRCSNEMITCLTASKTSISKNIENSSLQSSLGGEQSSCSIRARSINVMEEMSGPKGNKSIPFSPVVKVPVIPLVPAAPAPEMEFNGRDTSTRIVRKEKTNPKLLFYQEQRKQKEQAKRDKKAKKCLTETLNKTLEGGPMYPFGNYCDVICDFPVAGSLPLSSISSQGSNSKALLSEGPVSKVAQTQHEVLALQNRVSAPWAPVGEHLGHIDSYTSGDQEYFHAHSNHILAWKDRKMLVEHAPYLNKPQLRVNVKNTLMQQDIAKSSLEMYTKPLPIKPVGRQKVL